MNKSDLRNGMIAEIADGNIYTIVIEGSTSCLWNVDYFEGYLFDLYMYEDDLTHFKYADYDIVKIYDPKDNDLYENPYFVLGNNSNSLIWER